MDQQNNPVESFNENELFENLSDSDQVDKVFRIDLIFEEILKWVIFDNNHQVNRKMVQTVRLVHEHWLNKTSTLLTRSSVHLFVIKTGHCLKNEILFDQIHPMLTSPKRLATSLLPFKLILTIDFFMEDNHQSLLNCLTQLGDELTELQVIFPGSVGVKMSMVFPKFTLPQLRKLSFEITWKNEDGVLLLKQILNASDNLQHFTLKSISSLCFPTFPQILRNLKLPESLLSIEIDDTVSTEYVNILSTNHLPNLKHLNLNMPITTLESDMLFQILESFQCPLSSLQITSRRLWDKVVLKFPKLENLELLQIHGKDYEFQAESVVPSVKTLKLDSDPTKESVSLGILTQVPATFPNVTRLTVGVNSKDMSGLLMYLFTDMTQLKSLRLVVREDIQMQDVLKYSSTLIGLPAWLISAHQPESPFFQSFVRKRGKKPSIINLSELTSFTLWAHNSEFSERNLMAQFYGRNLTDLLFTQSFFKMPKLRKVTLSENLLLPTQQIEEMWKAQGRMIEYTSVED